MRIVVGIFGGALVAMMLLEIFAAFLLPRRVKRDPRIVRNLFDNAWGPWKRVTRRLPPQAADTLLGVYGPVSLIVDLVLWVGAMMFGYACLQWAAGSHLGPAGATANFGSDLYFSAATMTTNGPSGLAAHTGLAKGIQVVDAASGLAVLAIVIGYLPALYQAFSAREATVSQLDARAGSPPSAGRLIIRSGQRAGWPAVDDYLASWETWVAELMETHLAYPVLVYFRSQHVNQNWLSAMCCVLDASALTIVAAPGGTVDASRFTFAIARHAVADLTYTLRAQPPPRLDDRLPDDTLEQLLAQLREVGLEPAGDRETMVSRLRGVRELYEPHVAALATHLELELPLWLGPESPTSNWRTTAWH